MEDYNIIVINLIRAKERKELIAKQFNDLNLKYHLLEAVDGNELSEDQKNKYLNNPGGWRDKELFKPGELGCILSHIKAVQYAKDNNLEYAIILEDDVNLSKSFEKGINKALNAKNNLDLIYLGAHIYNNRPPLIIPSLSPLTYKVSGSYSYIIKKEIYDIFINEFSNLDVPADDIMEKLYLRKKIIKAGIFFPFIVYPSVGMSYIWGKQYSPLPHLSLQFFSDTL